MYSMVLMMAMTTAPESIAFGNKGCNGCTGGSSCHGLFGGCNGLFGGKSCHGCTGGSSCHGLFGGCNGLFGGKSRHGCTGGSSCHGVVVVNGCMGCTGGKGGLFHGGLFGRKNSCHGCTGGSAYLGCTGGTACYGCTGGSACHGCTGGTIIVTPVEPKTMPKADPKKQTSAPATITLKVPADAKVTIDGNATTSTSTVRVYSTPAIAANTTFTYTIEATVVRDGKILKSVKEVTVKAGENTELELNPVAGATVAAR